MAALLPLEDLFAAFSPAAPVWMLPVVFASMTVSVTTLLERRWRVAGVAPPIAPAAPAPLVAIFSPTKHNPGPIDLRDALAELVAEVRAEADAQGVRLELAIPSDLMVRSDSPYLRPAVRALLCNAIAHAPGGQVFVGAMRAEGCVRLIIIDDGKTASRPIAAPLRRPLARLLASSGTGLVVDHRPGDGTTLVLSLPEPG
jgi:hypothetical protein